MAATNMADREAHALVSIRVVEKARRSDCGSMGSKKVSRESSVREPTGTMTLMKSVKGCGLDARVAVHGDVWVSGCWQAS